MPAWRRVEGRYLRSRRQPAIASAPSLPGASRSRIPPSSPAGATTDRSRSRLTIAYADRVENRRSRLHSPTGDTRVLSTLPRMTAALGSAITLEQDI